MQCKTVEELMALGKAEGIVLTEDEAEAFLAELSGYELEGGEIKKIAGVTCPHFMYHGEI
jgi:dTDP-4-amino-4,6-dideoxygalactose transaminase